MDDDFLPKWYLELKRALIDEIGKDKKEESNKTASKTGLQQPGND